MKIFLTVLVFMVSLTASELKEYENSRFGFSGKYPSKIFVNQFYSDNGDGVILSSQDGLVKCTFSAINNVIEESLKDEYKSTLKSAKNNNKREITYKVYKKEWYVVSGYNYTNNTIFYQKRFLTNSDLGSMSMFSGFHIEYPIKDKKKYSNLVTIINKHFKPAFTTNIQGSGSNDEDRSIQNVASQFGTVHGLATGGEGFLSVRDKPKGKEIGRLYNGNKIEILGTKGKWYKIYDHRSSTSGWSHGKWISLNSKISGSIPAIKEMQMLQVNIYDNESHATYSTAEIRNGKDYCVIGVALSNYDKPSANLVHISTENCVSFTNSKGVEVICTKNKKMCKTKIEVQNFITKTSKNALMKELALQEEASNDDVIPVNSNLPNEKLLNGKPVSSIHEVEKNDKKTSAMSQLEVHTTQDTLLDNFSKLEKSLQVLKDKGEISQTCNLTLFNAFSNLTTFKLLTVGQNEEDSSLLASAALIESYLNFKKSKKVCISKGGGEFIAGFINNIEDMRSLIDRIEAKRVSK